MATLDDMQLLREYVADGSEQAFNTLLARHVSMVHSVALRHVRDPHQAEEITQAVFVTLARKAGTLSERTVLSGWLFHTARLTAANSLRTENRRARREQEAYMQSGMRENQTNDPWGQMAPRLDEAIASLNESDRNAIVLRFIEGMDFKEAAAALGATEDGTRMRVNRAVEKLRAFLARRGVVLSAAVIAGVLSTNAVQAAPPALIGSVAVAVAKGTSTTASTSTLIKGTLKLMAWTKLKIAAITGAALLLAAGTATVAVKLMQPLRPPAVVAPVMPAVAVKAPTDPVADMLFSLFTHAPPRNSRGPGAIAMNEAMRTNPPVAAIRLALQEPGRRISGSIGTSAGQIAMGPLCQVC